MAKNRFNASWLHDHINDPYVKLAQREGYRARAAYKLKEIDEAEKLIKPGMTIVDLGACPGSWSQYCVRKLKGVSSHVTPQLAAPVASPHVTTADTTLASEPIVPTHAPPAAPFRGRIVALDLLPMEPIADVEFLMGDFRDAEHESELIEKLAGQRVHLVLSDMAPNLSGVAAADAARMSDLIELALNFSLANLHRDGALLVKCFHGSGYSQTVKLFKQHFVTVKPLKPKASRDKSAESFLLGRGLKSNR